MISVGSDFSGVGAFDQALIRLGIKYNTVFACDMDKYARQTYIHNYGEPDYFPMDVYDREIPTDPLDIYMTSPPCQAFSLAGKRKGEDDKRGILFYNSHEFIKKNNPRFFIFENVKGLLSDDSGKTFRRWVEYLGGKSINGNPVLFPHTESVPYHIYFRVLNAKNYGIPQNRERVFIVGIRDDVDNDFTWPKEIFLEKRLRDVLEPEVDEKYYLSDNLISCFVNHIERQKAKGSGFDFKPKTGEDIGSSVTTRAGQRPDDNFIKVKSATSKGYEVAEIGEDIINFEQPNIETRRGRVGKGVAQTVTTGCQQGVAEQRIFGWHENENVVAGHRGDAKRSTVSEHVYHKESGVCTTIQTAHVPKLWGYRIRRLTPRECFRLMDFDDSFTWPVSDTQAYKQAGNSICVGVLAAIIGRLRL
jgi:DNA (cytosine-5)-methyltransferase 1